jgi:hypothetical protein
MNESQPNFLSGTISVSVSPENGGYSCQVSSSFNSETIRFYGETQDHAIAIALECMAAQYRNEAEQKQNGDLNIEEAMLAKHPELKRYHVTLHSFSRVLGTKLWVKLAQPPEEAFECCQGAIEAILGKCLIRCNL